MRHRTIVTGSNGRLGRALAWVIEEEHGDELADTVFATRDEIDITDYFRLRSELERIEPTVIVNCAAYAQVDGCEQHPEAAERVNAEGARFVARAAREVGARVIHVSTDLVFDGRQEGAPARRLYREDDPPNPLSVYAASKLAGEEAVAEETDEHLILRSSWFFGPWPADRFPELFLKELSEGRSCRMVSDRLGSPTYLRDLARAVARLILTPARGVLHFANTGEPTSRYHVLAALAEMLGLPASRLVPLPDDLWTEDAAPRPAFSALDPSRYAELTGERPRPWRDTLAEYVAERSA
ncbi:MAG TPA: dTDP-4-dehydrorhamnose reductase [Candidatus Polarisedimenticolia bacterium]|nr:dTDP-4-dehydrorhamnose reductase [Candidatus Polarisedimenticolia bacterium]